jgi:hypothetical protein
MLPGTTQTLGFRAVPVTAISRQDADRKGRDPGFDPSFPHDFEWDGGQCAEQGAA